MFNAKIQGTQRQSGSISSSKTNQANQANGALQHPDLRFSHPFDLKAIESAAQQLFKLTEPAKMHPPHAQSIQSIQSMHLGTFVFNSPISDDKKPIQLGTEFLPPLTK